MIDLLLAIDLLFCIAGSHGQTDYDRQVEEEARQRAAVLAEYRKTWEDRYR